MGVGRYAWVELAMGEAGRDLEVEACHLQRLSLRLVDAHGKAQPDRKLEPLELKRQIAGIMGIRGINMFSPLEVPVMMVASITLGRSCLTASLVPLQIFGGSRLHTRMIGAPIFSSSL